MIHYNWKIRQTDNDKLVQNIKTSLSCPGGICESDVRLFTGVVAGWAESGTALFGVWQKRQGQENTFHCFVIEQVNV